MVELIQKDGGECVVRWWGKVTQGHWVASRGRCYKLYREINTPSTVGTYVHLHSLKTGKPWIFPGEQNSEDNWV